MNDPSTPSPYRQTSAESIRLNTVEPDSAITPTPKSTAHYLARRLEIVFNDLGLLPHIPSDWLQPGPDGLAFRSLTVREADKFTLAIEDVAHGYRPPRTTVSPDQLRLF
jgi:hypothetical protein